MASAAEKYKALLSRAGVQWGGDGLQESDLDALVSEDESYSVMTGEDSRVDASAMDDSSLSLPSSMKSGDEGSRVMDLDPQVSAGLNLGVGAVTGIAGDVAGATVDRERVLMLEAGCGAAAR